MSYRRIFKVTLDYTNRLVGAERFTLGILPFALRAALYAFKIIPDDFVNSLGSSTFSRPILKIIRPLLVKTLLF